MAANRPLVFYPLRFAEEPHIKARTSKDIDSARMLTCRGVIPNLP